MSDVAEGRDPPLLALLGSFVSGPRPHFSLGWVDRVPLRRNVGGSYPRIRILCDAHVGRATYFLPGTEGFRAWTS